MDLQKLSIAHALSAVSIDSYLDSSSISFAEMDFPLPSLRGDNERKLKIPFGHSFTSFTDFLGDGKIFY